MRLLQTQPQAVARKDGSQGGGGGGCGGGGGVSRAAYEAALLEEQEAEQRESAAAAAAVAAAEEAKEAEAAKEAAGGGGGDVDARGRPAVDANGNGNGSDTACTYVDAAEIRLPMVPGLVKAPCKHLCLLALLPLLLGAASVGTVLQLHCNTH